MFSQVSVILFRGWVGGYVSSDDQRGVYVRGRESMSTQGGMFRGRWACLGREVRPEWGGYVRGVGMSRGLSYIYSQKFGHYFESNIS